MADIAIANQSAVLVDYESSWGVEKTATTGVASVTITNMGSSYETTPAVEFTPTSGGSGAAGTAVMQLNEVVGVTMTNPGTGYLAPPTVAFTGGGGTSAAGTAVLGVISPFKLGVVSADIVPAQDLLENPTIRADFNEGTPAYGKKSASGSLSMVADLKSLPWILEWLTGNRDTTGSSTYEHVHIISDDMPKSAVIETAYNIGGSMRYSKASGCRINSLSFPIDPVGFLQLSMDVAAKDVSIGSNAYSAGSTDWSGNDPIDQLQLAAADVTLDGSAVAYIMKGNVNIACNLNTDDFRVGANATRGSLVPSGYKVSGSLTLGLDNVGVLTLVTAGTPTSLSFEWTNSTHSLLVEMGNVYLSKTGPGIKGPGPITFDVNFKATYDATDTSSIVFTVTNDQAGTIYS